MTDLKKQVSRIAQAVDSGMVFEAGHHRQVVVTLVPPSILRFRAKGCKRSYDLTYADCYVRAVKIDVAAAKKKKAADKKAGKLLAGSSLTATGCWQDHRIDRKAAQRPASGRRPKQGT